VNGGKDIVSTRRGPFDAAREQGAV